MISGVSIRDVFPECPETEGSIGNTRQLRAIKKISFYTFARFSRVQIFTLLLLFSLHFFIAHYTVHVFIV